MNDDTLIPMDDPAVEEVMSGLARPISPQDIRALLRSVELRGLSQQVNGLMQGTERLIDQGPWPYTYADLFDMLHRLGRPIDWLLQVLAESGVLGAGWSQPAKERVWALKGWHAKDCNGRPQDACTNRNCHGRGSDRCSS